MTLTIRILAWLIPTIILSVAFFQTKVDPRLLVLDPMVAADVAGDCCYTYYGIISTLGVFGWIAAAALSASAAIILWRLYRQTETVLFAGFAAFFSLALGFDDAFLFHENIAPKFGVPQTAVLAAYLVLAGVYCLLGRRIILKSDLFLFLSAGFFLALSMGLDVILHSTESTTVFAEDGAKFIGISCWFAYHFKTFIDLISVQTTPISLSHSLKRTRMAETLPTEGAPA